MNALEKEFEQRKHGIKKSVELLFKANMKFTDWDIPEVDDEEASKMLIKIIKEAVEEIEKDIQNGKYSNY